MKALNLKALRDLWLMRGQALAIALVIASGIAMLVMSQATLESMRETRALLYQEKRFSDIWVNLTRAPQSLAGQLAEIAGVGEVETRITASAKLEIPGFDEPVMAQMQSLPDDGGQPRQNQLHLRAGRLPAPGANHELLVSNAFAQAHGLAPGAHLRATVYGRSQSFTVAGIGISPEYLNQSNPNTGIPDDKRYAIVWAPQRALEAALNMDGAFNQATFKLAPGASEQSVIEQIDRLLARYGSLGATGRMEQMSHRSLHEEFRVLATMAFMFPAIFLGVAAFLLNMVFKRLIGMQRDQVAIIKAFGYSTWHVALHYVLIVTLICIIGTVVGSVLGAWLGSALAQLYQVNFHFPYLAFTVSPQVALVGLGVTLAAALLGTGRAVFAAASEPVAQAMRPPAPERFTRTLLERMGLSRWLSQPTRMIWRQLERHPGKALLSVIGLACAGGIVVMGNFQRDAITHLIAVEFRLARQYDIVVNFIENTSPSALHELRSIPGVRLAEGSRTVPVRLRSQNRQKLTSILGMPEQGILHRPVDTRLRRIALREGGLTLGHYLAKQLGVTVGDTLWVEVLQGRQTQLRLPVVQLVNEYSGMQAYMNLDELNRALGDGDVVGGALLTVEPGMENQVLQALNQRPRVAGASSRSAMLAAFRKMFDEVVGLFSWVATLMAVAVNFGVVYNSARMALAERGRELASLRVLGFGQGEVSYILLGELGLLVLLSVPAGMLVGYGLAVSLAHGLQSELYRIPATLDPSTYAYSALVTIVSAIVSALAVNWRVRKLDLIGVLKTRE